jgi:hypothetical protein
MATSSVVESRASGHTRKLGLGRKEEGAFLRSCSQLFWPERARGWESVLESRWHRAGCKSFRNKPGSIAHRPVTGRRAWCVCDGQPCASAHLGFHSTSWRLISRPQRLGHSKVGITLDLYSHVLPGMQADAVVRVDDALQAAINRRTKTIG